MKRLLLAALLLASCASVQKPVQTSAPAAAPQYATDIAQALCDRNAAYVAAHTSGRLTVTEQNVQAYFDSLDPCGGIRYIGADGPNRFVFILLERAEIPYEFTFNDALQCVDVR